MKPTAAIVTGKTTEEVSLYDEIIELITNASLIDEAQKKVYIDQIKKEGLSAELRKELHELFVREQEAITQQIQVREGQRGHLVGRVAQGYKEIAEETDALVKANQEGMDAIVMEHTAKADELEKGLHRALEAHEQKGEADEAAQIRKDLGL